MPVYGRIGTTTTSCTRTFLISGPKPEFLKTKPSSFIILAYSSRCRENRRRKMTAILAVSKRGTNMPNQHPIRFQSTESRCLTIISLKNSRRGDF